MSLPTRSVRGTRWHLFCKVVDNYGDAGVCWRLARILAHEHGAQVTLWIDLPAALARLVPTLDPAREGQQADGVDVRHWPDPWQDVAPPDAVIEAFGCGLPETYAMALADREPSPPWLVLEYLSAEAWVESLHARPSPHPRLAVNRRFWFPGFTPATGGLLREHDLFARRDAFRSDPEARDRFMAAFQVPARRPDELTVSLFCYPQAPVAALATAWSSGSSRVTCITPQGPVTDALLEATDGRRSAGALTVHPIPFLPQDGYDRLLWACDLNFVRGEDSFVRAQWAARPLVWQAYPQAEDAHLAKLRAFLDRHGTHMPPAARDALAAFEFAWNGGAPPETVAPAWAAFAAALPALARHARDWAATLASAPELTGSLVGAAGFVVK